MLAAKLLSNTVLQSIQFADDGSASVSGDSLAPDNLHRHHPYVDLQLWKAAVHPILERNIFRPRIIAAWQTQTPTIDSSSTSSSPPPPTSIQRQNWRQKLLLPAVCAHRNNPNVLYMILSAAADIVADTGTKSCIHNKSNHSNNVTKYPGTHTTRTVTRSNSHKRKAQGEGGALTHGTRIIHPPIHHGCGRRRQQQQTRTLQPVQDSIAIIQL
jgi:hypothetical protein